MALVPYMYIHDSIYLALVESLHEKAVMVGPDKPKIPVTMLFKLVNSH